MAAPTTDLDLLRKNPVDRTSGSSCSGSSAANACTVGYFANSTGVTRFLRRAFAAMRSGKPGPVLVEVPNPVFEATHEGKLDYVAVPMARTAPDPDAVKAAAKMLLAAKKPVLWAGQGVHYAEAGASSPRSPN